MTNRYIAAAAVILGLTITAQARSSMVVMLPDEMQGQWCIDNAELRKQASRAYMSGSCEQFKVMNGLDMEVTATGFITDRELDCTAIKVTPFNVYHVRASGTYVNAWGPGLRITFRCKFEEDPRSHVTVQEWQISKGYLLIDEAPKAKRGSK